MVSEKPVCVNHSLSIKSPAQTKSPEALPNESSIGGETNDDLTQESSEAVGLLPSSPLQNIFLNVDTGETLAAFPRSTLSYEDYDSSLMLGLHTPSECTHSALRGTSPIQWTTQSNDEDFPDPNRFGRFEKYAPDYNCIELPPISDEYHPYDLRHGRGIPSLYLVDSSLVPSDSQPPQQLTPPPAAAPVGDLEPEPEKSEESDEEVIMASISTNSPHTVTSDGEQQALPQDDAIHVHFGELNHAVLQPPTRRSRVSRSSISSAVAACRRRLRSFRLRT